MATLAQPISAGESRAGLRPRALVELLLVGGATPLLFVLSWALRRTLGLAPADLAFGFTFFYARAPHQRSALRRHLPPLLRAGARQGLRRRAPPTPAGAVHRGRPRGARGARRLGRDGAGDPLRALAGAAHPAHVPARRVALREAGVRRDDGARGAARRALPPARAAGHPRSLLRRVGLRVGEPVRSRQGGGGEGRRLHEPRAAGRARAPHARRLPRERGRAPRRARAEVAARGAPADPRAAHGAALQHLGLVGLLERRPARRLRHPRAPLGAVPLFRVAPEGERGARARGAALVRAVRARADGAPRGVGARAGVALLPRRTGGARRAPRPAPVALHRPGGDAVLRGDLRRS